MHNRSKTWILPMLVVMTWSFGPIALAAVQINVDIPVGPNAPTAPEGPIRFIQQVYNFGFLIGGLTAFAAIVYGGTKYTLAAGDPSGQSEGKEWIKSALLGLLLLALATLILRTINPELANPQIPSI